MAPAAVGPGVMTALEEVAQIEGILTMRLPRRAAHDGMHLAHAGVPIGMVFVRSRGGISHAPAEFSTEADCEAGARVLARGAIELMRSRL